MMQSSDLAFVVSTRICHDLISPIGAIINGVDLVREIQTSGWGSELSMIGQSAERASDLLQFYRIAFGSTGEAASDIGRETLVSRVEAMIASQRIELSVLGGAGPALTRAEARLICLMSLCARSMTGMRGRVTVSLADNVTLPISISTDGETANCSAERFELLMSGPEEDRVLEPRDIEFAFVREAADAIGGRLSIERGEGNVTMRVDPHH